MDREPIRKLPSGSDGGFEFCGCLVVHRPNAVPVQGEIAFVSAADTCELLLTSGVLELLSALLIGVAVGLVVYKKMG